MKIVKGLLCVLFLCLMSSVYALTIIQPMPVFGKCVDPKGTNCDCSEYNIKVFVQREGRRMNVKHPNLELKTFIAFFVEKDGSVKEVSVAKTCGDVEFDNIAMNMVSKMQNWQAAESNGEPLRTKLIIPFKL